MSIAVTEVRGSQLSALAPVARGRLITRNSATAYISGTLTPSMEASQTSLYDRFSGLESFVFHFGRRNLHGGLFSV